MNIYISRQVGFNAIFLFEMEGCTIFRDYDVIGVFSPGIYLYNVKNIKETRKHSSHPETLHRHKAWY